jgi:hypothetical protein
MNTIPAIYAERLQLIRIIVWPEGKKASRGGIIGTTSNGCVGNVTRNTRTHTITGAGFSSNGLQSTDKSSWIGGIIYP